MKRTMLLGAVLAAMVGCKKDAPAPPAIPEPKAVCDKMAKFEKDQDPKLTDMCTAMLIGVKAKDNAAYECMAKCVDKAADKATADKCDTECPAFKKALGM